MRCWQKTGRNSGCFSPSSLGSPRNRERSWLKFIPGSSRIPSQRRSTHRCTRIHPLAHLSGGCSVTSFCVLQGCESCRIAAAGHPPLPPAPDSSSSQELPQQEALGPDVETWLMPIPQEVTTHLSETAGLGGSLNIFCRCMTRPHTRRTVGILTVARVLQG